MTVLPSPEAMIVICTVILIAYTAHVLDKAFASSEQFEAMLSARDRIIGLQAENAKLRELAARAWRLFTENGAVHPSDLPEVDAVMDGLRELGIEVDDG